MKPNQVLSDPTGRRARVVNAPGLMAVSALLIAVAAVLAGLFEAPNLKVLSKRDADMQPLVDGGGRVFDPAKRASYSALNRRVPPPNTAAAKRFAFVKVKQSVAHSSLLEHSGDLDALLPDFLVLGRNGELGQKPK